MAIKHGTHDLEREDQGDVTVVRVKTPRLYDDAGTRDIFNSVSLLVSELGRNKIVLNLQPVEYIDSLTVGKLVMLNRRTQAAGGGLALCYLQPVVDDILEATHLKHLMKITADEEAAVRLLA